MATDAGSPPSTFDPGTTRRTFCIASPDLFDVSMVPPLLARVQKVAPQVDIAVVPIDERRFGERLETGEVDVAVVPRFDTPKSDRPEPSAAGLLRRTLTGDRFVCLLRKGHPLLRARQKLTLKNYVALSHVLVSPRGEGPGPVDRELEQHGLVRRIALRVPNFCSALAIVRNEDGRD